MEKTNPKPLCIYFAYTANECGAGVLASRGRSRHLLWRPLRHFRREEDPSAWEVRPGWALGSEDLERFAPASSGSSYQLVLKGRGLKLKGACGFLWERAQGAGLSIAQRPSESSLLL